MRIKMRLVSNLYFSLGIMLALAVGGAALVIWGGREAAFHLERTNLAHQQYEGYLALSNHTYQLFKQFGDALLIGDQDRGRSEAMLLAALRKDIAHLRQLIGQEIQLVGQEEIEELDRLAKLEGQIENLLREYQAIFKAKSTEDVPVYWGRLSRMLDIKIDEDFNQLIRTAIEDEAEEVRQTRHETAAKIQLSQVLAVLFALLAVVMTVTSLWRLLRNIKKPIENLLQGTAALSRGDLDHRIDAAGPIELSNLAHAFNHMGSEIMMRERALSQSNEHLERTVTDRTAKLAQLLDTLKANDANRRRLLADVSHELRTPLTVIQGEADIALRGPMKPAAVYREALDKCRDAAKHTARLVDDLLFVARREAGETRLKIEAVDLAKLLPHVIGEHRSLTAGKNGFVAFQSVVDQAIIRADEGRIRQVMIILLENALHYGGGEMNVRLDKAPFGYVIAVTDHGPGMTEEEQAQAFERFFRGSNAADRYSQGTGLGLPVARAIVEAHGGEIVLTSEPGQGVTVSFTLPSRPPLKAVS